MYWTWLELFIPKHWILTEPAQLSPLVSYAIQIFRLKWHALFSSLCFCHNFFEISVLGEGVALVQKKVYGS